MGTTFNISPETLRDFCRTNHIVKLSLFGSVLNGTSHDDSDIDLLVEFEKGFEPGLIRLAAMERELSEKSGGAKIDLRTPNDLSRYFRDEVKAKALVKYAQ